mmetsp:Transcript_30062/g.47133  ORF Transcript_30062/g.47133 Transcript_30062/m.47133 type:complete len:324 (-) Transcript_30062:406-1377(-)
MGPDILAHLKANVDQSSSSPHEAQCFWKDLNRYLEVHGDLTSDLVGSSSTLREMLAVAQIFRVCVSFFTGLTVRLNLDSAFATFALGGKLPSIDFKYYGGSKNPQIQALAIEILDRCTEHVVTLDVHWLPSELNEHSDFLSKLSDHYGFSLRERYFAKLDDLWGPHIIDRFASDENVPVTSGRFNSRYWRPGSEAVDVLSTFWPGGELNWVHAPYRLLGLVINHIWRYRADCTLIVPEWVGSWWHRLGGSPTAATYKGSYAPLRAPTRTTSHGPPYWPSNFVSEPTRLCISACCNAAPISHGEEPQSHPPGRASSAVTQPDNG